jgi:hypothetical protein
MATRHKQLSSRDLPAIPHHTLVGVYENSVRTATVVLKY